jgi:hypothetical protein
MRKDFGALERIDRGKWRATILRALRASGGIVPDAARALDLTSVQLLDLLRDEEHDARRERLRRLSELVTDDADDRRPSVTTLRNLRGDRSSLPSMPPR